MENVKGSASGPLIDPPIHPRQVKLNKSNIRQLYHYLKAFVIFTSESK